MPHALRLSVALEPPAAATLLAFRAPPDTWLPTPLRRNGIGNWQLYLWAGEIGLLVDCGIGDAETLRHGYRRRVSWRPLRGDVGSLLNRAVPSFTGELSVEDRDDGPAQLVLTGTYQPPGGAAGSLIDRVALHRLARRTAKTFLAGVAARLHEEVRAAAN